MTSGSDRRGHGATLIAILADGSPPVAEIKPCKLLC